MQIEYEGFRKRTEYHCSILREYSRYYYLYFTIGKQWSKDLLNIKRVSISQHTCMARAGVKVMIGIKVNDAQGVDL